jgi:hypothetical protein
MSVFHGVRCRKIFCILSLYFLGMTLDQLLRNECPRQTMHLASPKRTELSWGIWRTRTNFAPTFTWTLSLYSKNRDIKTFVTFKSLAIILPTTRFNIKKFYMVPSLRLCVLYDLTTNDFCLTQPQQSGFVWPRYSVYCAVRTESLYKADTF